MDMKTENDLAHAARTKEACLATIRDYRSLIRARQEELRIAQYEIDRIVSQDITPIEDGNTDSSIVYMKDGKPHCRKHGAMIKVSESGLWRCIRAISLKTGKCVDDCRAGCVFNHIHGV
jgi:hypothetical protein